MSTNPTCSKCSHQLPGHASSCLPPEQRKYATWDEKDVKSDGSVDVKCSSCHHVLPGHGSICDFWYDPEIHDYDIDEYDLLRESSPDDLGEESIEAEPTEDEAEPTGGYEASGGNDWDQ